MSGSVNRVILIGNLCAAPDMRRTNDGRPIANFRMATNETWKDKNTGEKKERAEFHSVVCFVEGLCGIIEKYLEKGSKVYIEGQLQTRKWQDQEGNDRYSTRRSVSGVVGALSPSRRLWTIWRMIWRIYPFSFYYSVLR